MKLATVELDGRRRVVVVDPERSRLWPLPDVVPGLPPQAATDMVAAVAHLAARPPAGGAPRGEGLALEGVRLLAPITATPHNIMCVGANYHGHAKEFHASGFDAAAKRDESHVPEFPIVFTKPSSAIAGPFDDIPMVPGLDQAIDYEAELAVVVGRGGRFIRREDALDHVFGFTVLNDVTARDLQKRHKQWFLGKGIDGFAPMGPWIVTRDEVAHDDLTVTCRVNGEVRQSAHTRDLIFDIPAIIETISLSVTLAPGDVIATGTPEGVGVGSSPPRFLKEGDAVECEISGIGRIRSTLRRARPPAER
jgi:2-keto-4-pentenoate hydratase/2-oxohepta-3-ene-1,7-dioic acid hydratase in catechol pathway